mgnify:CR=1 FL=1
MTIPFFYSGPVSIQEEVFLDRGAVAKGLSFAVAGVSQLQNSVPSGTNYPAAPSNPTIQNFAVDEATDFLYYWKISASAWVKLLSLLLAGLAGFLVPTNLSAAVATAPPYIRNSMSTNTDVAARTIITNIVNALDNTGTAGGLILTNTIKALTVVTNVSDVIRVLPIDTASTEALSLLVKTNSVAASSIDLSTANGSSSIYIKAGATRYTLIEPTVTNPNPAYQFDTVTAHSSGDLLRALNLNIIQFSVAATNGVTTPQIIAYGAVSAPWQFGAASNTVDVVTAATNVLEVTVNGVAYLVPAKLK